jgi:Anticodon binding domain
MISITARDGFGYFGGGSGLVNDPPPFKMFKPDHNDVEIIVVSKLITQYAEAIEAHLKRQGLSVDLLFPNDDVPIGKVLANISSRGTLYAILVTPQNAEMQSITVNILYGQPAEHRNMPVDDALTFIVKNFQEKKRQDLLEQSLPTAVPIAPVSKQRAPALQERHPESIQNLLTLLADNRPLTVLQYDRIIQYLKERREMQLKVELGEGVVISRPVSDTANPISATSSTFSVTPATPQPDPEEELQKKILDILNKPSIVPDIVPKTVVAAEPSSGSTELLHDPKVQKALDSLLQGNLFNF